MTFAFDTSSFRSLGSIYPDVFKAFWAQFDSATAAGEIISTREVMQELLRQDSDHVLAWAKKNSAIFTIPTAAETAFVGRILAVGHFQQIIGTKQRLNGTPVADPFIIARAAVAGGTVITEERLRPNAARIPNVCQHFAVPWSNLEGFLKAKNWSY